MASPSILDLPALLEPIAADAPTGRDLAYEAEYDEIREARRAEDAIIQGGWQRQAKAAEWDRVLALGVKALTRQSKDLLIAAWMTEALVHLHGFAGLRDGLLLMHGLQDQFWDGLYPEIEEGDLEPRVALFEFLNQEKLLPFLIRSIPLTAGRGQEQFSYLCFQEARATDNAIRNDPAQLSVLLAEGKLTSEEIDKEVAQSPRVFYEELVDDLRECIAAFTALDRSNDRHFGRKTPSLDQIRKSLDDCRTLLEAIVASKRHQELPEAAAERAPDREESQTLEEIREVEPAAEPAEAIEAASGRQPILWSSRRRDENVQFTVYRPRVIRPQTWYPLLAFAHLAERRPDAGEDQPDPVEEVKRLATQILGELTGEFRQTTQDSPQAIPYRGELTFLPEVVGVEFNPPRRSFLWEEDVHREEFRLRAAQDWDGKTAQGRLTVFLGGILLAEVGMSIRVDSTYSPKTKEAPATDRAQPYRKIFASYSHKDVEIVHQLEWFARLFGDEYLRDWTHLRSGEVWTEGLERMIRQADIFQLFWSRHSMDSPFVRREWEYALSLRRPHFVRPTYWEEPLPCAPDRDLPPEALHRLHFQRIGQGTIGQGPGMSPVSSRLSTLDNNCRDIETAPSVPPPSVAPQPGCQVSSRSALRIPRWLNRLALAIGLGIAFVTLTAGFWLRSVHHVDLHRARIQEQARQIDQLHAELERLRNEKADFERYYAKLRRLQNGKGYPEDIRVRKTMPFLHKNSKKLFDEVPEPKK